MNEYEIPRVNDVIRKQLDAQFKTMAIKREVVGNIKADKDTRTCHKCHKPVPVEMTVKRPFKKNIKRFYRLCMDCCNGGIM